MMSCPEDKILVEATALGDKKAFQKLFEKYHERIYFAALKILKSPDLSQEVVQDIFIKIWDKREKLNSELSFVAFLFKISNNLIFNILKKASREESFKKEFLYHANLASNHTEDSIISMEYNRIAIEAVTQLPPQRKLVFELCRHEGKTYEEVAETLGISKGTVKDHMVKASKSIKAYVHTNADIVISILLLIGMTIK